MVVTITEILNNINSKKIYSDHNNDDDELKNIKDEDDDLFSHPLLYNRQNKSHAADNNNTISIVNDNPLIPTNSLFKSIAPTIIPTEVLKSQIKSVLLPGISTFIVLVTNYVDTWIKIITFTLFIFHIIYMDLLNTNNFNHLTDDNNNTLMVDNN
ncbi:MAG: LbFV-ORF54-like protein [Cotesia congregata filamentous virus 2]